MIEQQITINIEKKRKVESGSNVIKALHSEFYNANVRKR